MFRPTGLFKSVACPQRATCSLQNCFFSHQAVETQTATPSPTASVASLVNPLQSENERSPAPPPPKRRKIDDSDSSSKPSEAASNTANSTLKSILKKPNGTTTSASSTSTITPSTSKLDSSQSFNNSFDSESGRYINVETTDKKTGMRTKTRIERGGPINIPPNAGSSSSSRGISQASRALHTTASKKNTLAAKDDVTGELLKWGSPKATGSASKKPLEPERLVPRDVPKPPSTFDIRLKLLTALHDQFVRLDPASQETAVGKQRAIKLARDEEETAAAVEGKAYPVIMKNRIYTLMKMKQEDYKKEVEEKLKAEKAKLGEESLNTTLSPDEEVRAAAGYVHSFSVLKMYEYIVIPPSEEEVGKAREGVEASHGEEVCERCQSRFRILDTKDEVTGLSTTGGKCTYHHGKAWATEKGGQKVWQCCQQPQGETQGCTEGPTHVFNVKSAPRLATLWQFVETPTPVDPPAEGSSIERAICLDCEMAFTTKGFEMVRLTATRFPTFECVVDVLVKPFGEVLDLNTRFSGVTPEQWAAAPAYNPERPTESSGELAMVSSPLEARNVLFKHIDASTIMIGHALENDLKSTRIIHPRVVDTAILYPHPRGFPFRNSLKYLVQKTLGRYIQSLDSDKGHDSKEDANEAGNLVRARITLDVKSGKIGKDGIWTARREEGLKKENETPVKATA
ncbi:hypothetical protein ABW19_dt0202978 [Dactylella cylindrospora]|nr:hypothetical protein ABW19_dt0202978 [Dactylella cylindrospora]